MNRFEEMNVAEQQEICGGGVILPIQFFTEKVVGVVAGAVAGAVVGAIKVLSGK